uniref:DUF192 domain-containing protein n=1 Tax=Caldiarchaeum subterraneum TaxID=311458 RepID=A0A7J3VUF3_CALS0
MTLVAALLSGFLLLTSSDKAEHPPAVSKSEDLLPYVLIDGVKVFVELADTAEKRSQGLSDRDRLEEGWGMLFVFEKPGIYSFWMYWMRFPLDIIWVDAEGRVVYLVEKAPPCQVNEPCPSYTPSAEAVHVLEVRAGFVEENRIRLGSRVVVVR